MKDIPWHILKTYQFSMTLYSYEIQIKQYKKLRRLLIPLFLDLHDRYYFNILRMITLFYHLYIEHKIYAMEYLKNISILHDTLFIQNKMSKWDDDSTWEKIR